MAGDVLRAAAQKAGSDQSLGWGGGGAGYRLQRHASLLVVTYFLQPGSTSERFPSPKRVPPTGDQVLQLETVETVLDLYSRIL